MIVDKLITRPENIFNTVGHTCSGETLEGFVELLSRYEVTLVRLAVADLEGVQGFRSNPPLEPNYFVFMGNLETF